MTIHREGRTLLFVSLVILFAINWAVGYFFPEARVLQNILIGASILFYLIILQFFRIPIFEIQKNQNQVLAPADGKVVVIEEAVETEYLGDKRIQVSIFMSVFNVHANWVPVRGTVIKSIHHDGKHMAAFLPKSSTENERSTVVIETEFKTQILLRQIAGALARRIVTYAHQGKECHINEHLGFIKFGSRVDIFFPLDTEIFVQVGESTIGNETIIARLNE